MSEEVTEEGSVFRGKPLQDLGRVVFEGGGQAVGEAHLIPDQFPPQLDQLVERAECWPGGRPDRQFIPVAGKQVQEDCSVAGIILGSRGGTSAAIARYGLGMDRKEDEKIILG